MRVLKTLAAVTATTINDHDFRNINEVKKFLDTLLIQKKDADNVLLKSVASDDIDDPPTTTVRRFGLTDRDPANTIRQQPSDLKNVGPRPKFKPADTKELEKHFEVVQTYVHQIELLESLVVRVKGAFQGDKKLDSILKDIDSRRKDLLAALAKAQDFLNKVAKNKIPESVEQTFRAVTNPIVRVLTGRYRSKQQLLQVNAFDDGGSGVIQFTLYTKLANLKNDKGFVYKDFFIIVQCAIDARGVHHYFVDTSFKFEAPSKAPLNSPVRGHSFIRPKDGLRLLQTHMKADEHLDVLTSDSLPMSEKDVSIVGKSVKDLIKSVKVDEEGGTIRFQLVPGLGDQKVQNIYKEIMADITGLLHSNRQIEKMKNKVTKTVGKKGEKGHAITIWFTGAIPRAGQAYRDNSSALHSLKGELGLSDDEVKKIARILRGRQNDGA